MVVNLVSQTVEKSALTMALQWDERWALMTALTMA